jgi:hypothetical protein
MSRECDGGGIAPLHRKLLQGQPNPIGHRFEESGMVMKDPEFVDFGSTRPGLRLRQLDVLPILAAP